MATKKKTEAPVVDGVSIAVPAGPVQLPPINVRLMDVTLVGTSSLIMHAWSKKAKEEMLAKQQKKAKQAKSAKDPQKDYEESIYYDDQGNYAFPAVAVKLCAVDACSFVDGITKVQARGAFHVIGNWVRIQGEPRMREDMVRVGMTTDIRYRAEFLQWQTSFAIRYNANVLSEEQIRNLFNLAGFSVGLGDWRPQKDGSHGMFVVEERPHAG